MVRMDKSGLNIGLRCSIVIESKDMIDMGRCIGLV